MSGSRGLSESLAIWIWVQLTASSYFVVNRFESFLGRAICVLVYLGFLNRQSFSTQTSRGTCTLFSPLPLLFTLNLKLVYLPKPVPTHSVLKIPQLAPNSCLLCLRVFSAIASVSLTSTSPLHSSESCDLPLQILQAILLHFLHS